MAEFIFTLLANLLGWYLKKQAKSVQAKKDLVAFTEIMHRNGLRSVKMRLEAADGIDRAKNLWEQEKKEEEKNGFF